jgi:hypothetical protein
VAGPRHDLAANDTERAWPFAPPPPSCPFKEPIHSDHSPGNSRLFADLSDSLAAILFPARLQCPPGLSCSLRNESAIVAGARPRAAIFAADPRDVATCRAGIRPGVLVTSPQDLLVTV